MTRIIGGIAGSRKLASPAKATRPTSDRIRESVFSRLVAREVIDGARVLDLYAGTGALALEALSRGAVLAHLVERDGKAAAVCVANARTISKALAEEGVEVEIKIVNKSVSSFLATPTATDFDLIFIDPPYEITNAEVTQNLEGVISLMSPDGIIALERSSRTGAVDLPKGLSLTDDKSYGDTTIYWLSRD